MVMVAQLWEYIKNHLIGHVKGFVLWYANYISVKLLLVRGGGVGG